MNEKNSPPRWAAQLSSLFIGWLTFLLLIALGLIGLSFMEFDNTEELVKSGPFLAGLVFFGFLCLTAGVIAGRRACQWLMQQEPRLVYLCLLLTFVLTLMTFPQLFLFTIP